MYMRLKRLGELKALSYSKSLVVRTNITGWRNRGAPTFIEWLFDALMDKKKLTLFDDFFTSTIDVDTFVKLTMQVALSDYHGLINIACDQSLSKANFIEGLASELSVELESVSYSSVSSLLPKRANSLGLDCSKAKSLFL